MCVRLYELETFDCVLVVFILFLLTKDDLC
jgi:hypothetical protein